MMKRNLFSITLSMSVVLLILIMPVSSQIQTTNMAVPSTNPIIFSVDNQYSQTIQIDQTNRNTSGLVKILNYNTIEAGANVEWKEVIKQENPDIILQVETGDGSNVPKWKNEFNNYFENEPDYDAVTFDGTSGTDGQAVYSRFPIVDSNVVDIVTLDDGTNHSMNHPIIHAVVDILGTEVNILVNHLTCCDGLPARLVEQEGVINYMDSLGDVPIIYGGDFNSDSPEDTGDVAPFQGTLGTEPIGMMLNSSHEHAPEYHNFTDTYRALNPHRKGYTLNHLGPYERIDHFRGRIDYIFVNHHLTENMVNSSRVTDLDALVTASDHIPMYTWFNFIADEVDFRPPLAPHNVSINVTSSSTDISWSANSEIDLANYTIYRNGTMLDVVDNTTTTFTDTSEYQSGEVYVYTLTATDNSTNEGRLSLPVYADPGQEIQLSSPSDVQLHVYTVKGGITFNWTIGDNGGTPVKYVKIYKSINADGTFVIDDRYTTDGFISIPPGFELFLKITAVNSIGESELSEPFSGIGGAKLTTTTPPTNDDPSSPSPTSDDGFIGISLTFYLTGMLALIPLIRHKKQS